ncbi:MAG: GH12 family glycosyl hydrolase domain-containing protein [Angustibacter sp.]
MFQGLKKLATLAIVGLAFSPLSAAAQTPRFVGTVGDTLCGPEDYARINDGKYYVFNGIWNAEGNGTAEQCIEVTEKGFITRKMDVQTTTNAPLTYPAVKLGCGATTCSPGSQLPLKTSDPLFKKLHTQTKAETPNAGEWNAAYDLFFRADSTPGFDGSVLEFMVWYNTRWEDGRVRHPIGKLVDTVEIAGDTWDVWYGPNKNTPGQNTLSYVRHKKSNSIDFMVEDLYADAVKRNYASRDWYLNWINSGFEVWKGALGLNILDFSIDYNGRPTGGGVTGPNPSAEPTPSASPSASPKPSTSPTPSTKPSPPAPSPSASPSASPTASPKPSVKPVTVPSGPNCEISTDVILKWKGGYLVKATITNNRKTTTMRWRAWLPMTPGQDTGGAWRARDMVFANDVLRVSNGLDNGTLAAGESSSFFAVFYQSGNNIRFTGKPGCTLG